MIDNHLFITALIPIVSNFGMSKKMESLPLENTILLIMVIPPKVFVVLIEINLVLVNIPLVPITPPSNDINHLPITFETTVLLLMVGYFFWWYYSQLLKAAKRQAS